MRAGNGHGTGGPAGRREAPRAGRRSIVNRTTCTVDELELIRLLDGELTENLARELRDHVATCPACGPRLRTLQGLLRPVGHRDAQAPAQVFAGRLKDPRGRVVKIGRLGQDLCDGQLRGVIPFRPLSVADVHDDIDRPEESAGLVADRVYVGHPGPPFAVRALDNHLTAVVFRYRETDGQLAAVRPRRFGARWRKPSLSERRLSRRTPKITSPPR